MKITIKNIFQINQFDWTFTTSDETDSKIEKFWINKRNVSYISIIPAENTIRISMNNSDNIELVYDKITDLRRMTERIQKELIYVR